MDLKGKTYFPGMGPWMSQQLGVTKTLHKVRTSGDLRNPPADQGRVIWLP